MKSKHLGITLLSGVILSGCSLTNLTSMPEQSTSNELSQKIDALNTVDSNTLMLRDYSGFSSAQHNKTLHDYAEQLIMELDVDFQVRGSVSIASFVDFDETLQRTNRLGNQLAEVMIVELSQLGYSVTDINVMDNISASSQGNFVLSREKGSVQRDACCVLTGTLVYEPRGVRVNARLVQHSGNSVLGASSVVIPYFVIEHLL
ncbi:FlgO family outer membrane protein [Alteromonas facilis]|uniref:FlgO family outer membrane protein n=1 Tax=Alteromonas facilis TaxID=2048004 RepID=UPI000C287D34|nr:FlgO family outer membrane protein [Alteromonas facilis]